MYFMSSTNANTGFLMFWIEVTTTLISIKLYVSVKLYDNIVLGLKLYTFSMSYKIYNEIIHTSWQSISKASQH